MKQTNEEHKSSFWTSKKWSMSLKCYAMIATQLIGFVLFTFYPIMWAAQKAWYYYNGIASQTNFVGWENFIRVFTQDSGYWSAWITTLKFALIKIPIEIPLALFLAVLLNKKLKGTGFYRSVFFLPSIISVAIIGLIFSNMFDYFGFINGVLMKLGIIKQEINWFENTGRALMVLAIGGVWNTFGTNVLYLLGALKNVPEDLYESAYLEGAGPWTMFRKITVPLIAPVFQVILLLSITGTLHTNDYILVTTNGAPGGSTYTVMSYIVGKFVPGFAGNNVNIGYGCAVSLVTSVLMATVAVIYSKASKKLSNLY